MNSNDNKKYLQDNVNVISLHFLLASLYYSNYGMKTIFLPLNLIKLQSSSSPNPSTQTLGSLKNELLQNISHSCHYDNLTSSSIFIYNTKTSKCYNYGSTNNYASFNYNDLVSFIYSIDNQLYLVLFYIILIVDSAIIFDFFEYKTVEFILENGKFKRFIIVNIIFIGFFIALNVLDLCFEEFCQNISRYLTLDSSYSYLINNLRVIFYTGFMFKIDILAIYFTACFFFFYLSSDIYSFLNYKTIKLFNYRSIAIKLFLWVIGLFFCWLYDFHSV